MSFANWEWSCSYRRLQSLDKWSLHESQFSPEVQSSIFAFNVESDIWSHHYRNHQFHSNPHQFAGWSCLSGYAAWTSSQTERMQRKDQFSPESWLPLQPHADRIAAIVMQVSEPMFLQPWWPLGTFLAAHPVVKHTNQYVESFQNFPGFTHDIKMHSMQSNRGRLKGDFSTCLWWKLNLLPPWAEHQRPPGRHMRCLVLIAAPQLDLATVTFLANKMLPRKPEQGWWVDGGVLKPNNWWLWRLSLYAHTPYIHPYIFPPLVSFFPFPFSEFCSTNEGKLNSA